MAGLLGGLTFATPLMLAALAVLPAIWWLLRLTPPSPQTIVFPPARLLLGLAANGKTPNRSPWWLTLLRISVAAAVIAALSGPSIAPGARVLPGDAKPILAVVDNGWAAASRWEARTAELDALASEAENTGQTLILAPSASLSQDLRPLTPSEFRQRAASLLPQSYTGDRSALAAELAKQITLSPGAAQTVWLSDGVEDKGAGDLRAVLETIAGVDRVSVVSDPAGKQAFGLAGASAFNAGENSVHAKVLSSSVTGRSGRVSAVTARGETLAVQPFSIASGTGTADVTFDLPLDIRNQIAAFAIEGEASAGAVHLLDSTSQRKRVGVIASAEAEGSQPLLSPGHYLEKALAPFAEVTAPRTSNLDIATADLVARSPSVIVLSDIGRLSGAVLDRLASFAEKGGTLVRFAGPRLEEGGGDSLMPAPLREGGRTLGGAMTWSSPQTPAPFEQGSPFQGLLIPGDVTISRQVLIEPASLPRTAKIWATLADGTPLVSAAKRGAGLIVFFHVTANSDWSNLPLSGLFVEMMRKIVEMSLGVAGAGKDAPDANGGPEADPGRATKLKPLRMLDGFGKLVEPPATAQAVSFGANTQVKPHSSAPAGLYGEQNATRALNILAVGDRLEPLQMPTGAKQMFFAGRKSVILAPWLFLAAAVLLIADTLATALLAGGGFNLRVRQPIAVLALALCSSVFSLPAAKAEIKPGPPLEAQGRFALEAALETKFAYVITGDTETDRVSLSGLFGLSKVLNARTAVEPGEPMGIDPARDELVFFPIVYWPVLPQAAPLPDAVLAKISAYMKQGGLIIFDTKNDGVSGMSASGADTPLSRLLGKLDLPPLQRIPDDHVLTKAFYLLQSFPGRWDNGDTWVEAGAGGDSGGRGAVKSDGVSSIIVTSNDLAGAWALDTEERPLFAAVPGGEQQREMSYRAGVNIVMYALTGNYKADQVHVPAILERLGH